MLSEGSEPARVRRSLLSPQRRGARRKFDGKAVASLLGIGITAPRFKPEEAGRLERPSPSLLVLLNA